MQQYEASKTKSIRPSEVSLETQTLLALTYQNEYRTLYHISIDFEIYESFASRIFHKIASILIKSGQFDLPKKLPWNHVNHINWSVIIVDATKIPVERQKKQGDYCSGKTNMP